ncbi:uncharacterized protein LOC117114194 [Anneissia japonica]|uniref:uncharacterized protein LOC117114194 n=1 Tax=Anneissia japonica TaxID=1529436 RepID=UPI001425A8AD|nr:uncharacterized protein LOC117114194 [Anneissia japonica]
MNLHKCISACLVSSKFGCEDTESITSFKDLKKNTLQLDIFKDTRFVALCFVTFNIGICEMIYFLEAIPLARESSIGHLDSTFIMTIFTAGSIICRFIQCVLPGKSTRFLLNLFVFSQCIEAVSFYMLSLARGYWAFAVASFIHGTGAGLQWSLLYYFSAKLFNLRKSTVAVAWCATIAGIAETTGAIQNLVKKESYRIDFEVGAVFETLSLIPCIYVWKTYTDSP